VNLYIGGRWEAPATAEPISVISPHSGEVVAMAPSAGPEEIDLAVSRARASFDEGTWARLPVAERVSAIRRFEAAYSERANDMADVISSSIGTPITFSRLAQVGGARGQIAGTLSAVDQIAWEEEPEGLHGSYRIWREPVGIVAAITAWNFPQMLIVSKLIPALLCGCSVVVKPALESPLDALLLAEIFDEVGVPEGVVSIVPGGASAGRQLVAHPEVDMVTFTGSTAVGREIGSVCGGQVKRVSLELGGKSAAIVLEDADPARTAEGLKFSSFLNAGQACAAQTRVLAPRSRYNEIVDALAAEIETFTVGDPADPATEIGPLVNKRQQERVRAYIDSGRESGARVVIGDRPLEPSLSRGAYVQPTLLADVDNGMKVAREEIFGPVLVVIPYGDEQEAVRLANDSTYGLAGSVWTKDKARGLDIARRIRTGVLGINSFRPDPTAPHGGFKQSGIGREYGKAGLETFIEVKAVHGG
jgi:aldehyde dehydrogenase (NAD+)